MRPAIAWALIACAPAPVRSPPLPAALPRTFAGSLCTHLAVDTCRELDCPSCTAEAERARCRKPVGLVLAAGALLAGSALAPQYDRSPEWSLRLPDAERAAAACRDSCRRCSEALARCDSPSSTLRR